MVVSVFGLQLNIPKEWTAPIYIASQEYMGKLFEVRIPWSERKQNCISWYLKNPLWFTILAFWRMVKAMTHDLKAICTTHFWNKKLKLQIDCSVACNQLLCKYLLMVGSIVSKEQHPSANTCVGFGDTFWLRLGQIKISFYIVASSTLTHMKALCWTIQLLLLNKRSLHKAPNSFLHKISHSSRSLDV